MMVWNVTKADITERMAVSPDEAWDVPGESKGLEPDPTRNPEISQEMIAGRLDVTDVNAKWLAEFKKEHGVK
jgi:hypothetical protein